MSSLVTSQEVAERIFATSTSNLDPEVGSMDPAERLEFSRPSKVGIHRFDARSDGELKDAMFAHPLAMERERAIWEYADRHGVEAIPEMREVAGTDPSPPVRWTTLWALQKFGGAQSLDVIAAALRDKHPEVRDWARLLLREITGTEHGEECRDAKFDESNHFDQTLPLQIAGYARVLVPQLGWVQATLSPQWFESIMGRVMACTCEETFDKELIIEKRISGYHPDGKDHYEIYKFRGLTFHPSPQVTHHIYESRSTHTFYPSGKVEDSSIQPFDDVEVILNRKAEPVVVPPARPLVTTRSRPTAPPRQKLPGRIVSSVRGKYMGFAFINLNRVLGNGMMIGPGEVQLSSVHHPVVGEMTNTFLWGTFKGKLSDLDDDGYLDVNTEPCHATLDGELDYGLEGRPSPDPFDPCHSA